MREIIGYCDGGARNNGKPNSVGGYGAFLQYLVDGEVQAEKKINGGWKETTNNVMELKGAIELMKAINDKDIKVTIYFDSKYVKDGLESWLENWKKNNWLTSKKTPVKNKELWQEIDYLKNSFTNLSLQWCKGHADNIGNNIADGLCNEYMDFLEQQ